MLGLLRLVSLVIAGALLSACAGASAVVPFTSAAVPVTLTPLPREQQEAIRASVRVDPRFAADLAARKRMAAQRHDQWYEFVTRGDGGRAVQSARKLKTLVMVTTCTTTYLNISGTYDTSTDPIVRQTCTTSYVDDGTGPSGTGDPSTDPALVDYGEPWSNFDTGTEKACKRLKTKFVSLSKNAVDNSQAPQPGQTNCGPKNDMSYLDLTGGRIFLPPCDFSVTLTGRSMSINPLSGSTRLPVTNSDADGVRINADCSYDFVRI